MLKIELRPVEILFCRLELKLDHAIKALSDLVSHKTKIDSLFLDEGFGTLDREVLDNLNASGKMIGVISHVEALKERIPVQIEIKKMSGLGVSRLDKKFSVSK